MYQQENGGGIKVSSMVREYGFTLGGHHCHKYFEMYYVESGASRFLAEENIIDLGEGDCILIPPLVLHYTRYVFGACRRTIVYFQRDDITEAVRRFLPRQEGFFTECAVFHLPKNVRRQVEEWLEMMRREEKIGDEQSELIRQTSLQALLLLFSRVCSYHIAPPMEIKTTDEQVLEAARYISRHYMNAVTTQEVAAAVGFSPNYLSRKFRKAAGVGLHEYLVFIRLHHAALELASTASSITDIAFRCGFSDSNYFKDAFKKKYGVTPREYRKMM